MTEEEKKVTEEQSEIATDDNEPIYYNPKILSLVSISAMWISWLVLLGFLANIVGQCLNIQAMIQQQGLTVAKILSDPAGRVYLIANLVTPFVTGLALFITLQAASVGLNALMEIDFNIREPRE